MADVTGSEREICVEEASGVRCSGIALGNGDRCIAHATEEDATAEMKRLSDGKALDARGVSITSQLMDRLLAALPRDNDRPTLRAARFEGAIFHGEAVFTDAIFQGDAEFSDVTFKRDAKFRGATFGGQANFSGATFGTRAWFAGATFPGDASFLRAIFHDWAGFGWAIFGAWVRFDRAVFHAAARFDGVTFERAQQLGPMLVHKQLGLDQAIFKQRVQIQVGAAAVCCRRTQFVAGVRMRLRWARVVLDDADLAAPSILAGVAPFPSPDLDETCFARAWARLPPSPRDEPGRPILLSACRADLAGLTIKEVRLFR